MTDCSHARAHTSPHAQTELRTLRDFCCNCMQYRAVPRSISIVSMNTHYAAISTDNDYRASRLKLTAAEDSCLIMEMDVFRMLDTLRPTATGLDQIPAWFLRLGAPIFAAPLASLFHQSLATGVVPRQWKSAVIMPTPKIATPAQPSDFRPVSITPVLSRSLGR